MRRPGPRLPFFLLGVLLVFSSGPGHAATFVIETIHVHDVAQTSGEGIMIPGPALPTYSGPRVYLPQIEVDVKVSREALSRNLIAKAYFFDGAGHVIQSFPQPSPAHRGADDVIQGIGRSFAWPVSLPADTRQSIFFPLPAKLPAKWSVVVVFGNANGVVTASVPDGLDRSLDYPESKLAARTLLAPDVPLTDAAPPRPVIEQKVDSDNPRYPSFTLLLHLPHGISDPKQVRGVLAMCLLANSVGEIRDKLDAIKPQGDANPYFAFAESHGLAIIAWGARWVWNSTANFDELDRDQIHSWDEDFQPLADAWDRGVQMLVQKEGIPDHDYLLYGVCAGGEWAHRLALHEPDRFLAVQMHISTSYDAPTPAARRVMWLLTTGEFDGGCDRARRFYSAARDLGYPIIFKSVLGLNHADSPVAEQLGVRFFDYALAAKARRDAANAADLTHAQPLDLSGFASAPFYGDLMNQDMFAARDKDMIPSSFLVPLPSREIAEAWNQ